MIGVSPSVRRLEAGQVIQGYNLGIVSDKKLGASKTL